MVDFMLAKDYQKGMGAPKNDSECIPPVGWLCSEKYDGYRARFMSDEKIFLSRAQKQFNAPEWFIKAMPPGVNIDGELWVGRDNFQDMGVVRKKVPIPEEWANVKYVVYDAPDVKGTFEERLKFLKDLLKKNVGRWEIVRKNMGEPYSSLKCPVVFARQVTIRSEEHLDEIYQRIIKNGGEGIMLKDPKSMYQDKRSNYLLKYKPSFDEEAIIMDYKGGKGKYEGMLGGFVCKPLINMDTYHLIDQDENHEFTISGMDDEVRSSYKETHPPGTIISIEHSGKTESGKPRFGRYVRKRDDVIIKDKVECNSLKKRDNVIHVLKTLADHEKVNGEAYKCNSYLRVISSLNKVRDDSELTETNLKSLNGVGKSIYEKIDFILRTGSCPQYDTLQKIDDPRKLFMDIHGVGPKNAKYLVEQGFKTIEDLISCEDISKHLNEKQLIGLKHYSQLLEKIPQDEISRHEILLKKILQKTDKSADLTIAGSYRRRLPESGDIDVLLKSDNPETYNQFIKSLNDLGYLVDHLALGNKKYNGVCKLGKKGLARRIDIMYTKPEEYPFAIFYFTGSGDFNKVVRQKILDKGMTINEYSLKDLKTKEPVNHVFTEEKDIFNYLGFDYVEPWDRM
jgi:DNA polymerase/3'-5' exonuclease PolX